MENKGRNNMHSLSNFICIKNQEVCKLRNNQMALKSVGIYQNEIQK